MIILNRQVEGRPITNETGDNAPMLLHEAGTFKRVSELLPLQKRIGYNPGLFVLGKRMHGRCQGANGFFHTLVWRCQFKSGIKTFQMPTELLPQDLAWFGRGEFDICHSQCVDDTV